MIIILDVRFLRHEWQVVAESVSSQRNP